MPQVFRTEPRNAGLPITGYSVWWPLTGKRRGDRGERRVVSAKRKEVIQGHALQEPPLPLAALFQQVQKFSKDLSKKAPVTAPFSASSVISELTT